MFELLDLGADRLPLVQIAARHILLPHPDTVREVGGAVFPTVRDQKAPVTRSEIGGRQVLLDDNTSARWALLWAHGQGRTDHPYGWTFAHVWSRPRDPDVYTHLANLCMMPEYFGTLSDKEGPLCAFLKWHAHERYGWRPAGERVPAEPEGYAEVAWRYFPHEPDPWTFIRRRLAELNNQRVAVLRELMPDPGQAS